MNFWQRIQLGVNDGSYCQRQQPGLGLSRALDAFGQAPLVEHRGRYDFYSNIRVTLDATGNATTGRYVEVAQGDRTIRVNWDRSFATTAGDLGVTADEALRKTDFGVYQAAISAAFDTVGVASFNINGAWRPHPEDYESILGRISPLPNERSPHISSRALDINMINDVSINNGGYVNHVPRIAEPDIVERFTDNLLDQAAVRQMFQPWRMWGNTENKFVENSDVKFGANGQASRRDDNAILHRNHLHFGF